MKIKLQISTDYQDIEYRLIDTCVQRNRHLCLSCQTQVSIISNTGVYRIKHKCLTNQLPIALRHEVSACCYFNKNSSARPGVKSSQREATVHPGAKILL